MSSDSGSQRRIAGAILRNNRNEPIVPAPRTSHNADLRAFRLAELSPGSGGE
jgi:hypothetical protein